MMYWKQSYSSRKNFPSRQGLFQTLAASGPVLSAGAGMMAGGPVGGLAALALTTMVGRGLASKGLQKYLSGQTKFQRLNKALMRKYSKELQRAGFSARQAAVILGVDDAA